MAFGHNLTVFDVLEHGAVGNGVHDDGPAINAIIDLIPSVDTTWSQMGRPSQAGLIVFPVPPPTSPPSPPSPKFYMLATKIHIPQDKSVFFLCPYPRGARLRWTGQGNYAIYRQGKGPQAAFGISGLVLDGGGLELDGPKIGPHHVRDCHFANIPDYAIRTLSPSIVNVDIHYTMFSECGGGVNVEHRDCDLWLIRHCTFVRNRDIDIVSASTGVDIEYCDFETRPQVDYEKPFINISLGVCRVQHNRFGSETDLLVGPSKPYAPPRDAIVLGPRQSIGTTPVIGVDISHNNFLGTIDVEGKFSQPESAIRLTAPPQRVKILDNNFEERISCLVNEVYLDSVDFAGQKSAQNLFLGSTIDFLYSGTVFSHGGVGFRTDLPRADTARLTCNLLKTTDSLTSWTKTRITVMPGALGPDGLTTAVVLQSEPDPSQPGSRSSLSIAAVRPITTSSVTFSAWLKKGTFNRGCLAIRNITDNPTTGNRWLTPFASDEVLLDEEWRRFAVTAYNVPSNAELACFILVGNDSDSQITGTILAYGPQLEEGSAVTTYMVNSQATKRADRQFNALTLGSKVIGYGEVMPGVGVPPSGHYEVGDIILNTKPTAGGKIGFVCVTAGDPGVWKEWGAIDP